MTAEPDGTRNDRSERHRRDRKTGDRAIVLVLVGLVLLMPPLANAFHFDLKIFGVPFTMVYLFGVWAALIICAARLAPALKAMDERGADGSGGDP